MQVLAIQPVNGMTSQQRAYQLTCALYLASTPEPTTTNVSQFAFGMYELLNDIWGLVCNPTHTVNIVNPSPLIIASLTQLLIPTATPAQIEGIVTLLSNTASITMQQIADMDAGQFVEVA